MTLSSNVSNASDVDAAGEWHVEENVNPASAVATALDALEVRVEENETDILAEATKRTQLESAVTATADRLTIQLSAADATAFAALAKAGETISVGPPGAKQNRTVYTSAKAGNRIVVALSPGVVWGSGSVQVPTGDSSTATAATNVSMAAAVDTAGEWHVEEDVPIPILAQASEELGTRVQLVEDVDGNTTLSTLARWLVKTTVGELTGGVGLYNDGTTVRFYVAG